MALSEKEMKEYEIRESDEFSSMEPLVGKPALRGLAKVAVDKIFDERQTKIEKNATNQGLSEMASNFGEYYKWMIQEEQEIKKLEEEKQNKSISKSRGSSIIDWAAPLLCEGVTEKTKI